MKSSFAGPVLGALLCTLLCSGCALDVMTGGARVGEKRIYCWWPRHPLSRADVRIPHQRQDGTVPVTIYVVRMHDRAIEKVPVTIDFPVQACHSYEFLFDPVVIQVPADWDNFSGTYSGPAGSGALAIRTAGPFNSTRTGGPYVAEPGRKLVVVGFPPEAPSGTYDIEATCSFTQDFDTTVVKTVVVGHVSDRNTLTGQTSEWFPPVLPEETDFSRVRERPFVWMLSRWSGLSPIPVGYSVRWLILTAISLTLVGGYLLLRHRRRLAPGEPTAE